MQVYKAFFKIIYKNLMEISIYVILFLFFAVFFTLVNTSTQSTGFTGTKLNIAFINKDKDSELVNGLKNYLDNKTNIIEIGDDTKRLQDALFFRHVEYILRVPEGFTDDMLSGREVQLQKIAVPGSTGSIYVDSIVNKYLNTALLYINNLEDITEDQLISYIEKDLLNETQVYVNDFGSQASKSDSVVYYFNYLAYSLSAILILGVCTVMLVFNNIDLKRRNHCSPMKLRSMNFQMISGNFSFAAISWVIIITASFFMYGKYMLTSNGLLLLLNSFIFTLAALSLSFLLANIVRSRNAASAAANVFALGSCFISGAFVPQELLSKSVLNIASFTPTFWYIKANHQIFGMTSFNLENLMPVIISMLIVLGFAVALLSIALVVIKQRRVGS